MKTTSDGVNSTYAGQCQSNGCYTTLYNRTSLTGDGGPATSALLMVPTDFAFDASDNLYIADAANYAIRKVDATSGTISTVAGSLPANFSCPDNSPITNGSSSTRCIPYLACLAVDPISGNLFFSTGSSYDMGNMFRVVDGKFILAAQVSNIPNDAEVSNTIVDLAFNSVGDLFVALQGAVYKMPAGGALDSVVRIADPSTGLYYTVSGGASLSVTIRPMRTVTVNPGNDHELWFSDGDNGLVWRLMGPLCKK